MSIIRGIGGHGRPQRLALLAGTAVALAMTSGCGLILSGGATAPSPGDSLVAQSALQEVVEQYVRHEQRERFELRVRLGEPIDRLPLFGERNMRADARFSRALIRRIDWIDVNALDEPDYVTLLAVRSALQEVSERAQFYENDLTPFAAASTFAQAVHMLSEFPLSDSTKVTEYEGMLASLASTADTMRADLIRRASQGIILSRSAVARAIGMLAPAQLPPPGNPLHLTDERVRALDSAFVRRAVVRTDSVIASQIVPSIARLNAFLGGDYGSRGPAGIGLWQYIGGREYYRVLVRATTTLDVTPEQAHNVGMREVARLDSALRSLRLRITGNPASAESLHAALRRDARYRGVTPEDVVDRILLAQSTLPILDDSGATSLGNHPIVVTPPAAIPSGDPIFGMYRQPSGRDSVAQYTPARAAMEAGLPLLLESLSFFAISPGRHDLLGRRLQQGRDAARWYAHVPAFSDGWGLYALDLARDAGAFGDSLSQYGALMLEMMAAVRLAVDGGIHYFGWTADQASAFIREHTMLDSTQAAEEVARIAHDAPGLGLAATMGVHEIRGVRRWMERELGSDFDARRFNRELRSLGPVPLQALGRHFEWWLWRERARIRDARSKPGERQDQGPSRAPES